MSSLRDFYLNDNHNLNNIPAELSQCPLLTILSVENCPLRDLPQPIVSGGSAMIIYVCVSIPSILNMGFFLMCHF